MSSLEKVLAEWQDLKDLHKYLGSWQAVADEMRKGDKDKWENLALDNCIRILWGIEMEKIK